MIQYTKAVTAADLEGIIQLQRQNLPAALTKEEAVSQGFVTVVHTLQDLDKMNRIENHIIAKDSNAVIAYLLAMTVQSREDIAVLQPMFAIFDTISYKGKNLSDYRYLVVGQVCVHKAYRGQGVFDACYSYYKKSFSAAFDFAITEIDATNLRSLAAHRRIGFAELHRYTVPDGKEWVIVLWDWNATENGL